MISWEDFLNLERASRDTIDFKRCYVDMAGDLIAGLILSQIVYWFLPGKNGKVKVKVHRDGHLWLVKRRSDWWEECRVTPKQVDRALDLLSHPNKARGPLIEVKIFQWTDGGTALHIRVLPDEFLSAFNQTVINDEPEIPMDSGNYSENEPEIPMDSGNSPKGNSRIPQRVIPSYTENTPIDYSPPDPPSGVVVEDCNQSPPPPPSDPRPPASSPEVDRLTKADSEEDEEIFDPFAEPEPEQTTPAAPTPEPATPPRPPQAPLPEPTASTTAEPTAPTTQSGSGYTQLDEPTRAFLRDNRLSGLKEVQCATRQVLEDLVDHLREAWGTPDLQRVGVQRRTIAFLSGTFVPNGGTLTGPPPPPLLPPPPEPPVPYACAPWSQVEQCEAPHRWSLWREQPCTGCGVSLALPVATSVQNPVPYCHGCLEALKEVSA